MPYVNIQIMKGATRDKKAQLVKEVTALLVHVLGKKPEHAHIVIQEISDEDWGFSGLLTDDWKKQQTSYYRGRYLVNTSTPQKARCKVALEKLFTITRSR
ncbi:4-oxalocrotonate tautomerase family protein [Phormidium tenue FACHB-886]|nr:4-oxalocrotonate tautomerase family protein [Phormidium tenue FACHB-886]